MTYQANILKASTVIISHIKQMKESKYDSVVARGVDFELFYNKAIEVTGIADVKETLANSINYGKDIENITLLKHYGDDIEFLIGLSMKLAGRLGLEVETNKHILENVLLKEIRNDGVEDNHIKV